MKGAQITSPEEPPIKGDKTSKTVLFKEFPKNENKNGASNSSLLNSDPVLSSQNAKKSSQVSSYTSMRVCKSISDFWRKIPHLLWGFYVESFYIPAYRWEWGKYRFWAYETHGKDTQKASLNSLRNKALKKRRREFIEARRMLKKQDGVEAATKERHRGCRRIFINVSGIVFETQARTISQFPDTLLGNPDLRIRYWNPDKEEYFFDRSPICFESILHFYQTGGTRLEKPIKTSLREFKAEVSFFELKGPYIEELLEEADVKDLVDDENLEDKLPKNLIMRKIWLLLEYGKSSAQAKIHVYTSILAIVLSTLASLLDTMDEFKSSEHGDDVIITDVRDPLFFIETVCVVFFTLEFGLRIISCPNKTLFMSEFTNIIDFISLVPFFIEITFFLFYERGITDDELQLSYITFDIGSIIEKIHRLVSLIRVFRILKLSRYSLGLQILGRTFSASLHELGLLAFFLMIGVILFSSALYFVEGYFNPDTKFDSIPYTFFWAISTMTTCGYVVEGGELPRSVGGRLVGSVCAVAGVLTLSLPVPVVVANFTYFYQRETQRKMIKKMTKTRCHTRACPYLPTCKKMDGRMGDNDFDGPVPSDTKLMRKKSSRVAL